MQGRCCVSGLQDLDLRAVGHFAPNANPDFGCWLTESSCLGSHQKIIYQLAKSNSYSPLSLPFFPLWSCTRVFLRVAQIRTILQINPCSVSCPQLASLHPTPPLLQLLLAALLKSLFPIFLRLVARRRASHRPHGRVSCAAVLLA